MNELSLPAWALVCVGLGACGGLIAAMIEMTLYDRRHRR